MKFLKTLNLATELLFECCYAIVCNNNSVLASQIRRAVFRTSCYLDSAVVVTNKKNFSCGRGCALYHGTYILNDQGKVHMGKNSHFGARCYANVYYGQLTIGDDVAIGPHTSLIVYSNHYGRGQKVTNVRVTKDIVIGNNVFIGANCVVLPGTVIHDNVVVGAGSVIKGELESNALYVGSPCQKLKSGWYE